MILRRGKKTGK